MRCAGVGEEARWDKGYTCAICTDLKRYRRGRDWGIQLSGITCAICGVNEGMVKKVGRQWLHPLCAMAQAPENGKCISCNEEGERLVSVAAGKIHVLCAFLDGYDMRV